MGSHDSSLHLIGVGTSFSWGGGGGGGTSLKLVPIGTRNADLSTLSLLV